MQLKPSRVEESTKPAVTPLVRPKVTLINGSLGGAEGNTQAFVEHLLRELKPQVEVQQIHLAQGFEMSDLASTLKKSHGFIFATGTYWDSWGSPLQSFLEKVTQYEGTDLWMGKPASVLVTMHSVGGKEVLSRLQGVLSTLGCLIPPMSGLVYSLATHLAAQNGTSDFDSDFWQVQDLKFVAQNFLCALKSEENWKSWPVDRQDPRRKWFFN